MAAGDRKQSDISAPPGAWKTLGKLLEARRRELGYRYRTQFKQARGLNVRMAADIEKAYPARINTFPEATLGQIARAYEVDLMSMLAVLNGRADALTRESPAIPPPVVPQAAGIGDDPPMSRDQANADRPYFDPILRRVFALQARGITDPSGDQLFPPGSPDAQSWDANTARLDLGDRIWLIAELQRRAARRNRDGGPATAQATA